MIIYYNCNIYCMSAVNMFNTVINFFLLHNMDNWIFLVLRVITDVLWQNTEVKCWILNTVFAEFSNKTLHPCFLLVSRERSGFRSCGKSYVGSACVFMLNSSRYCFHLSRRRQEGFATSFWGIQPTEPECL